MLAHICPNAAATIKLETMLILVHVLVFFVRNQKNKKTTKKKIQKFHGIVSNFFMYAAGMRPKHEQSNTFMVKSQAITNSCILFQLFLDSTDATRHIDKDKGFFVPHLWYSSKGLQLFLFNVRNKLVLK